PSAHYSLSLHDALPIYGLILDVLVHPANITDRQGAKLLLLPLKEALPRLSLIWADSGYAGKLEDWVKETLGWTLEIVKRPFEGVDRKSTRLNSSHLGIS